MAKKDKQAPAPEGEDANKDAAAEGAEGAEAGKKGFLSKFLSKEFLFSKKMLMFGAPALLVVLLGIGAGTYFMFFSGHGEDATALAEAEPQPITPPEVAFYDVPNILVNIHSPDGTPAYLKISLSLELNNEEEKTGIEALKDRMVDQFQSYLRELRLDDLNGSAGTARVKEELLRRVNVAAAPYKVRDVLIQEMIVQ